LGQRILKALPGRRRPSRRHAQVSAESRFEAMHTTGLTALVGREKESELLLRGD
jgi:hypothetical protein